MTRFSVIVLALLVSSFTPPPAPVVPEVVKVEPSAKQMVREAMNMLAASENTTPENLVEDPDRVAQIISDHAESNNLDPLVLVAIAWTESRFRVDAKGDKIRGRFRSCGITQIRTDFPNRPSCESLQDPDVAFSWTAGHLVATASKTGKLRLDRYNGGDYEVRIWRTVDWIRRQLPKVT